MTNEINELIQKIGQITVDNAPDEWEKIIVKAIAIERFSSLEAEFILNGESDSFDPDYPDNSNLELDITNSFSKLRRLQYEIDPENGPWYTAVMEINEDGSFNMKYDYDSEPAFEYIPSDDKFLDDFKKFPRKKEAIPEWLNKILDRNKA